MHKAEPLLLSGYRGMQQREAKIPTLGKHHLAAAAQRLIQLYESRNKPQQAAKWRMVLALMQFRWRTARPVAAVKPFRPVEARKPVQ